MIFPKFYAIWNGYLQPVNIYYQIVVQQNQHLYAASYRGDLAETKVSKEVNVEQYDYYSSAKGNSMVNEGMLNLV